MRAVSSRQSPSSSEKRGLPATTAVNVPGIVVPGIVLTQAGDQDELTLAEQLPPSPPKQVVLLSPGVVYPGRKGGIGCLGRGVVPQAAKQLFLLALVALAIWHLYFTLDMGAMHVPITEVTP